MTRKATSAKACARVTFEIVHHCGSWGHDCTVDQLHRQALDSAQGGADKVVRLAAEKGIHLRVVRISDVTAIFEEPSR